MTSTPRAPCPVLAALDARERAELLRQGAKAAARGDAAGANPMDTAVNGIGLTGEADGLWRLRRAAWRQGFESQRRSHEGTIRFIRDVDGLL